MKVLIYIATVLLGTYNPVSANNDGQFGGQQIISTNANLASTVLAADIDGDGDIDVVSASAGDGKVAWYENIDGKGVFESEQVISTSLGEVVTVHAADLDGDGDIDIISAADNGADRRVLWFENTNGMGAFGSSQTITTAVQITTSVYAADIDGDGHLDVLSSSVGNQDHKISWYKNINGQGSFGGQRNLIPSNLIGAYSVRSGDLDGDGDLDVVYGTINQVVWLRNTNGQGAFSSRIFINSTSIFGDKDIHLTDMDNDGDLDILFSSAWTTGDRISIGWYKNDGSGNFDTLVAIDDSDIDGAWSVYPADFDRDRDLDVVSASLRGDSVDWYENIDGQGTFSTRRNISENTVEATAVFSADIDGDGDMDVLSASRGDDKIAWYKNNITVDLIFANTFE